MTAQVQNVSVSISRPMKDVYDYAANPEHLPKWAAGKVKVKFVDKNSFGIIDHDVTLPNGVVVHNPLRVVKNGEGSEVIFTVFRQANMSDQDYEKDVSSVKKDLQSLKQILEK